MRYRVEYIEGTIKHEEVGQVAYCVEILMFPKKRGDRLSSVLYWEPGDEGIPLQSEITRVPRFQPDGSIVLEIRGESPGYSGIETCMFRLIPMEEPNVENRSDTPQ